MRQGNGAELLGANDPRSATIGLIYVAPGDDRESVLAAILTQEKLGRKQIAIVLPDQNRAFQRPVDFDGLKNMRRKLQAELVIIAPSGPGPAEFARQRHFAVYSTTDSFVRSLRDTSQPVVEPKEDCLGARQDCNLRMPRQILVSRCHLHLFQCQHRCRCQRRHPLQWYCPRLRLNHI